MIFHRVCVEPTHIQARTKVDKLSWLGTQVTLVFDETPKPEPKPRNWFYGVSRKFGFICYEKLQSEGVSCPDFEVRFCCDDSYSERNDSVDSLSYSENDLGEEKISLV